MRNPRNSFTMVNVNPTIIAILGAYGTETQILSAPKNKKALKCTISFSALRKLKQAPGSFAIRSIRFLIHVHPDTKLAPIPNNIFYNHDSFDYTGIKVV